MATFSWDVKRFLVLLGMGKPPLEIVPYSSERFVPFRLKQNSLGTGDIRAIVQIDQQPTDARIRGSAVGPPEFQTIRREVARVSRGAEDYVQLIPVEFHDTGRCQHGVGMHVMVSGAHRLLPASHTTS